MTGLLVADKLERGAGVAEKLTSLRDHDMNAIDWSDLLAQAEAQWRDLFDLFRDRARDDDRLQELAKDPEPPLEDE